MTDKTASTATTLPTAIALRIRCKSVDDLPAGLAVHVVDDDGDIVVECNSSCSMGEILSVLGPVLTLVTNAN